MLRVNATLFCIASKFAWPHIYRENYAVKKTREGSICSPIKGYCMPIDV